MFLRKNTKISKVWCRASVVPGTLEAEMGESLEPGRWRLQSSGSLCTSRQAVQTAKAPQSREQHTQTQAAALVPVVGKRTKTFQLVNYGLQLKVQTSGALGTLKPSRKQFRRMNAKLHSGSSIITPATAQNFGRLRWEDHLSPGAQDKPRQHNETPS
ncbi:hypothetical protein AAY473_031377 [Plecturocebus cupreus]